MSDKTTPELEHKPLGVKHTDKPTDDDCETTDHCDFVNEKEPLNKNNSSVKAVITNNKNDVNNKQTPPSTEGHVNSETRNTKLKKSNSYKVNNVKNQQNGNGHVLLSSAKIQQLEDELRKRSGLSRSGLILAIILIVLLFVLFTTLIVVIFLWPKNQAYPICKTPACLTSSAQILPMMNENVTACEDFREYSCGSWLRSAYDVPLQHKHNWDMKTQLSYQQKQKIRDLIVTLPMSPASSDVVTTLVTWKLKTMFDSCMDLENIEGEGHKPLAQVFTEVGNWIIQSNKLSANYHLWDTKKVLGKIHKEHDGTPFFRLDVVPDPNDALQNLIRVSPAGLGLPDRNFYFLENQYDSPIIKAYKEFIAEMIQHLGLTSIGAKQWADGVYHYEKRLAEITPEPNVLKNVYSGYKKITLREAKQSAPSVHLMDILVTTFPDAKPYESTQILVPENNYLEHLSNLISESDKEVISKYIMWNLAVQYFPYISNSFRQTLDVFTKAVHGEVQPLPRWEFCVDTLHKYMGHGVTALIQRHSPAPNLNPIERVFQAVKKTILSSYKQASWFSPELRSFILQKIESITMQVGLPTTFSQEQYVNDHYNSLYIFKSDFFKAIKSANVFRREEQQRRLVSPTEEARWIDALTSPDVSISYIVSANTINVPSSILSQPFYDPENTLPVIYARLGVELSHAILNSVSPWNVLYSSDGALLDAAFPAVNESIRCVVDSTPCVANTVVHALQRPSSTVANVTVYETITRIAAVRQAFKALQSQLDSSPRTHQPALESLDSSSVFFLAYTQSQCKVTSHQQNELLSILGDLSDTTLLKTILSQSTEFSDTFSCSTKTENICPLII
uniref:Endothelin-converting enzyme 1 n=1 Tax=Cacopsylla melanoneura TaxID=428564 RepID=A0A8D8LX74_9HEMI